MLFLDYKTYIQNESPEKKYLSFEYLVSILLIIIDNHDFMIHTMVTLYRFIISGTNLLTEEVFASRLSITSPLISFSFSVLLLSLVELVLALSENSSLSLTLRPSLKF